MNLKLQDFITKGKEKSQNFLGKIKSQRKNTKLALLAVLAGGTLLFTTKQCNKETTQEKEKTELTYSKNPYWEGPERDAKISKLPKEKLADGIYVIRDQGMTFYIVQEGDNLSMIREKLGKIEEFNYLKDSRYMLSDSARNIQSFNIPSKDLKSGLFIPIPLAREQRETSDEEFYQMSIQAVEELATHPIYGEDVQNILKSIDKEEIAKTMCAYARSETAQDWKNFSDQIGSVTLHRWEPHMKAFSFSHYHILMEKNADGKTPGPGLKARQKLGLSEGQTYHPKNGGKLFLAYRIEKNKTLKNKVDLVKMFNMENENDAKKFGKIYNGDPSYGKKLRENYQYFQKKFPG